MGEGGRGGQSGGFGLVWYGMMWYDLYDMWYGIGELVGEARGGCKEIERSGTAYINKREREKKKETKKEKERNKDRERQKDQTQIVA